MKKCEQYYNSIRNSILHARPDKEKYWPVWEHADQKKWTIWFAKYITFER